MRTQRPGNLLENSIDQLKGKHLRWTTEQFLSFLSTRNMLFMPNEIVVYNLFLVEWKLDGRFLYSFFRCNVVKGLQSITYHFVVYYQPNHYGDPCKNLIDLNKEIARHLAKVFLAITKKAHNYYIKKLVNLQPRLFSVFIILSYVQSCKTKWYSCSRSLLIAFRL